MVDSFWDAAQLFGWMFVSFVVFGLLIVLADWLRQRGR